MLARLWTTGLRADRIGEYETFAREVSLPMFRAQEGFRGCLMTRRENMGQVLTIWRDAAAVAALAQSPSYRATVNRIVASGVLDGEQCTEVTEIHLFDISLMESAQ